MLLDQFRGLPIFAFGIGLQEMVILGAIGVLLFGKRLPEVGKQLGRSLGEFKKGIQGIETELNSVVSSTTDSYSPSPSTSYDEFDDEYQEPTAPKFEPPASEPKEESPAA